MFSFLSLINSSVTIGLRCLLLIISAIISLTTINIFAYFVSCLYCTHQYFYRYPACHLKIKCTPLDLYGAQDQFFHVF